MEDRWVRIQQEIAELRSDAEQRAQESGDDDLADDLDSALSNAFDEQHFDSLQEILARLDRGA